MCRLMINCVHKETLLVLAPLLDKEDLGAEQHIDFNKAMLDLYKKTLNNVVAFIGDCNCATYRKISTETTIPLIGCASHCFNLAVNTWLKNNIQFATNLKSIHEHMVKLCKLTFSLSLKLEKFWKLKIMCYLT